MRDIYSLFDGYPFLSVCMYCVQFTMPSIGPAYQIHLLPRQMQDKYSNDEPMMIKTNEQTQNRQKMNSPRRLNSICYTA